MEDSYVVKICSTGQFELNDYYFYKDNLLHRETGPAVILGLTKEKFDKLVDKELYKQELIQSKFPPGYQIKYVRVISPAIRVASYYLYNEPYTEEEFNKIKFTLELKKELNDELQSHQSDPKKPLLKSKI